MDDWEGILGKCKEVVILPNLIISQMSVLSSTFRVRLLVFKRPYDSSISFVTSPQILKRVKSNEILKFLASLENILTIYVARICEYVSLYFLKHGRNKCKKLSLRQWFYYSISRKCLEF